MNVQADLTGSWPARVLACYADRLCCDPTNRPRHMEVAYLTVYGLSEDEAKYTYHKRFVVMTVKYNLGPQK